MSDETEKRDRGRPRKEDVERKSGSCNVCLDLGSEAMLAYLECCTGKSRSDISRTALKRYFDAVHDEMEERYSKE